MKNIFKSGINSNMLKTIAIIAMVIDHIGFYFISFLSENVHIVCRYMGRIAMPIFVYLLVQGFFHTKNFKKYLLRMGGGAVITQVLISILMIINIKYIPDYTDAKQVYTTINILFSFCLILIVMKVLHENTLIKKWDNVQNLLLKITIIVVIVIISIVIPMDYGKQAIILSILMYYIEKFKIKLLIEKNSGNKTIKSIVLNSVHDTKITLIYLILILFSIITLILYFNAKWTVIFAIVPIALYNGERGKINMKYIYYITFPLQHILLYSLAMIVMLT